MSFKLFIKAFDSLLKQNNDFLKFESNDFNKNVNIIRQKHGKTFLLQHFFIKRRFCALPRLEHNK